MDVARLGADDAPAALLVSSACHGVEGFCGSGVQNALLADPAFHADAARAGVAVVHVHALNPYGFSWWQRTTHENVDLNRTWHDFDRPLPRNAGYDALARWIVPDTWPPGADADAGIAAYVLAHGARALQTAVTAGQHDHPDGLFYGGRAPTWSQQTLRAVLRRHATRCRRLGWIDVHTGLGPSGDGERILACRDDAAALARARAWWGPKVTSIYDGSSASALLTGMMFEGRLPGVCAGRVHRHRARIRHPAAAGDDRRIAQGRPVAAATARCAGQETRWRDQAPHARRLLHRHARMEAAHRRAGARGGAPGRRGSCPRDVLNCPLPVRRRG